MANEPEQSQRSATTPAGNLEARIAVLETRLHELEARLGDRVAHIESDLTAPLANRLSHLEKRHDNLLRHTPDAREAPYSVWNIVGTIVVIIIIVIYAFSSGYNKF